jgi:hypothetical protein
MSQALRRQTRTGRFELALAADEAFKLFTAEGERLWVPGWAPEVLGRLPQATGLVFLTGEGSELTIWTVIESDRSRRHARYSRVTPGSRAGLVEVRVEGEGQGCSVEVRYDLTALSPEGEIALEAYSKAGFAEMLQTWQRLIAEFLASGDARERLAVTVV